MPLVVVLYWPILLASVLLAESGHLKDDIKIASMGPVMHLLGAAFWFVMYAAMNNGDISDFTFRKYLTVISGSSDGFFSTLFQQSYLMNILLLWANLFISVYPLLQFPNQLFFFLMR